MSDRYFDNMAYFRASEGHFWQWAEEEDVLIWGSGETIAYSDDLARILRSMETEGLPPLGPVLLLLTACRTSINIHHRFFLQRQMTRLDSPDLHLILDKAIAFLKMVSELPEELRTGRHRSLLIYQVVGYMVQAESGARESILQILETGHFHPKMRELLPPMDAINFRQELMCLSEAGMRFENRDQLEMILRTGLPQIPEPAPVKELPPAQLDLLDQLAEDPRTQLVGRLARRIVSTLQMPMHAFDSGMQTYGGISDISNRGSYDKLLISELANEDALLMARLVNNEALFLRREQPPEDIKKRRILLLDSSLLMWGTPRIYALSAALAFVKRARAGEVTEMYCLGGDHYAAVDPSSVDGVVAAMEWQDHSLHCGLALQRFFRDQRPEANQEYVLLTKEETMGRADFHGDFQLIKPRLDYILTVERDGGLQYIECVRGRTRVVQTAKLDLEEILFAPAPVSKEQKRESGNAIEWNPGRPLFVNRVPPLLFPKVRIPNHSINCFAMDKAGLIVINKSLRLLLIAGPNSGAVELLSYIEKGAYYIHNQDSRLYILVQRDQPEQLIFYSVDTSTGETARVVLSEDINLVRVHKAYYSRTKLYMLFADRVVIFDCEQRAVSGHTARNNSHEFYFVDSGCHRMKTSEALDKKANELIGWRTDIMYRMKKIYIDSSHMLVLGNYVLSPERINLSYVDAKSMAGEPFRIAKRNVSRDRFLPNRRVKSWIWSWPDGSVFFIDGRGLLHMRSSDPNLPEVSIVLTISDAFSCWASDGKLAGNTKYIPAGKPASDVISADNFYSRYIVPIIKRIVQS